MFEDIASTFESHDFVVQETAWDIVASHENLAPLRNCGPADSEVGKLLTGYPDLFVYHRQSSPETAAIFVVVVRERSDLEDSRARMLEKYFPKPILIVRSEADGRQLARWIDGQRFVPLGELLATAYS